VGLPVRVGQGAVHIEFVQFMKGRGQAPNDVVGHVLFVWGIAAQHFFHGTGRGVTDDMDVETIAGFTKEIVAQKGKPRSIGFVERRIKC
jgi:hypothetical protein